MKKKLTLFFLLAFLFLIIGLIGVSFLFNQVKREIVLNNSSVVMSLVQNHPELEHEIIDSLMNVSLNSNTSILEKYGLASLSSLEYLENVSSLRVLFYSFFFLFYAIIVVLIFIFLLRSEWKRKKEIAKIDAYLFSLLSNDIKVDLKDFQNGDLATLQNDLMKVTSRLKNALETSTKDKKELSKTLADISHQLKTPLTSLLILNDNLSSFDLDDATREDFLKKQEQILLHMKSLITTLLKVSQIESGMTPLKKEPVSLTELFETVLEQLDLLLTSKNISINLSVSKNLFVLGDFNWLGEAFLNILKNACEHSKIGGSIDILVKENPMYVEISIKDYGEGISKKDLKHIFERFYKSSSSSESIGIGLNLTKSILDRSNATIICQSEVGKYTLFAIHFYKCIHRG